MSRIKTKKQDILDYHYKNTCESNMGCDADEWHRRCWRCGYIRNLERCHIIPRSLNGSDTPENYVLLCNECHQEAPNVSDKNYMIEWIKKTSVCYYDVYWSLRKLSEKLINLFNKTSIHFGQGEKINDSTREWLKQSFLDSIGDYIPMIKDYSINSKLAFLKQVEFDEFLKQNK